MEKKDSKIRNKQKKNQSGRVGDSFWLQDETPQQFSSFILPLVHVHIVRYSGRDGCSFWSPLCFIYSVMSITLHFWFPPTPFHKKSFPIFFPFFFDCLFLGCFSTGDRKSNRNRHQSTNRMYYRGTTIQSVLLSPSQFRQIKRTPLTRIRVI